jgi:hypothetical protein
VLEKIIGTLALSIVKSVHTLSSLMFSFKLYSIATPGHSRSFRLKKSRSRRRPHACFTKSLLYNVIDFFYLSCTTEPILSLKRIKRSLPSFSSLLPIQQVVNSIIAAVACRFMQNRHAGRYLGSKRGHSWDREQPRMSYKYSICAVL